MKRKNMFSVALMLLFVGYLSFLALGHSGDPPTLLEDVNKDGVVNIQDLVRVATAFGQARGHDADVNRDGVVNILDLQRVSKRLGETYPDENATYHDIQKYIFDKNCASSSCHAAPANFGNHLNLTYAHSYENLLGRTPENPAAAAAGMKLVDPGNPDNSFLLTKLVSPLKAEYGRQMPAIGEIHAAKIDAIRTWIEAGAPQSEFVAGVGDLGVLRDPDEVFTPPAWPAPGEGYQLHLPPFQIQPGTEREVFFATQIRDENGAPVEGDIFINSYEIFYPSGSHHFILYRMTEQAVSDGIINVGVAADIGVDPAHTFRELDPADPQALGNIGVHRFFVAGTQSEDASFALPEGVALRLPGDTLFDMNSHYINALGSETLLGEVYINLYTLPPEDVVYEAIEIFASNTQINIPPGLSRVAKMDWYVEDELDQQGINPGAELHVMMLTSHMHRHGELFEITQMSNDNLLHRSLAYDDAPITFYTPPIVLDATDGLSFACTHHNYDRDVPIEFGFTSEDEMCLIVGYYYVPVNATAGEN